MCVILFELRPPYCCCIHMYHVKRTEVEAGKRGCKLTQVVKSRLSVYNSMHTPVQACTFIQLGNRIRWTVQFVLKNLVDSSMVLYAVPADVKIMRG